MAVVGFEPPTSIILTAVELLKKKKERQKLNLRVLDLLDFVHDGLVVTVGTLPFAAYLSHFQLKRGVFHLFQIPQFR